MHEIIQLDLNSSSWKEKGHSHLTVGVWSPYAYQELRETGRLFFLFVSDRASFSEKIFQGDAENVKIELIQHLKNNYPHSYVIKEKMSGDSDVEKSYNGDFRTMKPFLETFRELSPAELNNFSNRFVELTEIRYQSERADFLVNVLDGNSDLHYELASKLSEVHRRAEQSEQEIKKLIHNLRQNKLHSMANELLEQLKRFDNRNDESYLDETDENYYDENMNNDYSDSSTGSFRIVDDSNSQPFNDPVNQDYTEPIDDDYGR